MHQLVRKQKELTQAYAERNFNVGDLVRVHPGKDVYRYGGYDASCPDRIWLITVNNKGKWQVPAASIVSRLEKTTQTRPIGKLNTPILKPEATPLDLLLGTSFFGNNSLVENELLILDSVSGFDDFTEACGFLNQQHIPDAHSIKTMLPFGRITRPDAANSGWLRKFDDSGGDGEPIIAVTHSAEVLADYCIDAQARSKLVVVNGLGHIRNLQAYDDISQTQRLVLFADHDNEELIDSLGKRGCRFWLLDQRELLVGDHKPATNGILGSVTRWARNYDTLSVDHEPCEDVRLDEVWLSLDKFSGAAIHPDDNTLATVVTRAWVLFRNARSAWAVPTEDDRRKALADVDAFRLDIQNNRTWIAPDSVLSLNKIADALADCYGQNPTLGAAKGAALLRAIRQESQEHNKVAILVRSEARVGELRRWLSRQNLVNNTEVLSPRTLPINEAFDRVICVTWFSGDTMKQVVSKLAAPRVTVIGYPCERLWLRQFQPRIKQHLRISTLTSDEKTALIGGGQQPCNKWPEEEIRETTCPEPAAGPGIWDLEHRLRLGRIGLAVRPTEAVDTLPARYVRFSGDCYAFITETHKLAVATDMVSGSARPNHKLPERTLLDIRPGDFIVFPESGERELVQELADRLIGPTAEQLRKTAHLWKDALHSSGLAPEEFLRHARALNRPRHPATIRNWFADTSQIGPREMDDLVLIAIVTKDAQLEREVEAVRAAIEQLWSAHQSAGVRLRDVLLQRLPQVIGQVEESGTKVDLGELGSAWVVRVEAVEAETEPRGRGEVNRLLFEKSDQDISDLLLLFEKSDPNTSDLLGGLP